MAHLFRLALLLSLALASGGAFQATPAAAQQTVLEPGTRIRITTVQSPPSRWVAEFRSMDADTLHVAPAPPFPAAIPSATIQRIETRQPRSSARGAWRGAAYGFAIPLAGAIILSAIEEGAGAGLGMIAVTFGPIGGAIWGARNPGTRWQPIQWPPP
jgi:hypothetical protein